MRKLGIITYKQAVGAIQLRQPRAIIVKQPPEKHTWYVSPAVDGHLRAWWGGVRGAGKLYCGALEQGFDWLGDDPDWPDWVHVGALSQLASRTFHKKISNKDFARWMAQNGVKRTTKMVSRKNSRGRVVYSTVRTFYEIG